MPEHQLLLIRISSYKFREIGGYKSSSLFKRYVACGHNVSDGYNLPGEFRDSGEQRYGMIRSLAD